MSQFSNAIPQEISLPERLKQIRIASGFSQAKFAVFLGVSQSCVSYYENGERIPTVATCYRYIDIHNDYGEEPISLEDLIPRHQVVFEDRPMSVRSVYDR